MLPLEPLLLLPPPFAPPAPVPPLTSKPFSPLPPTFAHSLVGAVTGKVPTTRPPKPPAALLPQQVIWNPSPPIPPTATTWIEDTPAGTVNGFDPEVNVTEQDTICPD
jgi:hypothetical protein